MPSPPLRKPAFGVPDRLELWQLPFCVDELTKTVDVEDSHSGISQQDDGIIFLSQHAPWKGDKLLCRYIKPV